MKLFTEMTKDEQKTHTEELVSALFAQAETLRGNGSTDLAKNSEQIARRVQRRYNKTVAPKPKTKKEKKVESAEA